MTVECERWPDPPRDATLRGTWCCGAEAVGCIDSAARKAGKLFHGSIGRMVQNTGWKVVMVIGDGISGVSGREIRYSDTLIVIKCSSQGDV